MKLAGDSGGKPVGVMDQYSYYDPSKNNDYKKYKQALMVQNSALRASSDLQIIGMGKKLIDLILTGNPSTLIGSLDSTIILQNLTYDELTCYTDSQREIGIIGKFKKLGFKSNEFRSKYLRYKKKYLEKLNNIN